MTDLQKLELRAGEIRQRLAGLGGIETQTDETRAELSTLRTEYGDGQRGPSNRRSGLPVTPLTGWKPAQTHRAANCGR